MAITIRTSDYLEEKRVVIDGHDWSIKIPGAGTELRINQAQRRIKLLDRKINDGTATEEDFDLYDKLENDSMDIFRSMFSDGSKDNSSVTSWVDSTPMAVIMATFEEIKKQAEDKSDTPVDGQSS